MRRLLLLGLGLVLALLVSRPSVLAASPYAPTTARASLAQALPDAQPRTPLGWAQLLIQHLRLNNTDYRHTNTLVTWAGVNGATQYTSYTDCSGFLNALLTQTYGLTASGFDAWLHTRRPLAKDYYTAILAQNGFTRIRRITNLRPGDIIAIRYLNNAPGDNTGHIMLVAGAPQRRVPSQPQIPDTVQWSVQVIDSSTSGHGPTDTRRLSDGQFHRGAGEGILRLYADTQGTIVGYTWSEAASSVYFDATTRPLVVGRLTR